MIAALVLSCVLWGDLEVSFEEQLLGTVPENLKLAGPGRRDPDGNLHAVVAPIVWSPDGRQVAYNGLEGAKRRAVVGDEVGELYDYIDPPVFSPDGQHVVFRVGQRVSNTKENWWTLLDGKATNKSDWLVAPVVTNEGKLAYWEVPGTKIVGGGAYSRGDVYLRTPFKKRTKSWADANMLQAPKMAPDGSWFSLAVTDSSGKWTVIMATKRGEKEVAKETSLIVDYAVSPNGKEVAVVEPDPSRTSGDFGFGGGAPPPGMMMPGMGPAILRIGKKTYGKDYDNVGVPVYSSDSKHVAYKVREDEGFGIAVDKDEKAETPWSFVWSPAFSADSKRVGYVAARKGRPNDFILMSSQGDYFSAQGTETLVVVSDLRGKKKETFGPFEDAHSVVLPAKKAAVAFAAKDKDGWRIHCGEFKSEAYDEVGPPAFSEDGKQLAFGARSDRELWWRVMKLEEEPAD